MAALLASVLGLASREARACKCGVNETPIAAPRITGGPIDLREETVALRCDAGPRRSLVCTWQASYRLHNPDGARAVALALVHVEGAQVALKLDGRVVGETAAGRPDVQRLASLHETEVATRATWAAPADGEATLAVEATFLVMPWQCRCGDGGSNFRRHPWVSNHTMRQYYVAYGAGGGWGTLPATTTVRHDIPRRWYGDPKLQYREVDGRKVADVSLRSGELARLAVVRRWRADPGGPVIAAGLGWGPEGLRPRLRAGYELAYPRILVNSVVVETDALRRVMIVPSWELTFPDGWPRFLPDFGAGLGVPVEVVPAARPGVRVHGRFGFGIVHLIGSYDHFPAIRGLPVQRLGSLVLQVGF